MPHTKSAIKRLKQAEKRQKLNRRMLKLVKVQTKELAVAMKAGDAAKVVPVMSATAKKLDQAAAKGYIHPNKASRLKSRAAKKLHALEKAPAPAPKA